MRNAERVPVTIAIAGDVMLGRLVNEAIGAHGAAYPWGDLLPWLRSVDLLLVNLECALTRRTEHWRDGEKKAFYFRAHPAAVLSLTIAGVDFVSLANNHAGDLGIAGLLETLRVLDAEGIAHAGAGLDLAGARAPASLAARGTNVAVLAFADYPRPWSATATRAGINWAPVSTAPEDFAPIREAIASARGNHDLVVFSIHWGPNMSERPSPAFREFARAVIDAGADIFWGHSAHVVQGVEWRNSRLILFDTGDFVDDYAVDPELRNDLSALFLVRVRGSRIERLGLLPVEISHMQVNRAQGTSREWFGHRAASVCAELGTAAVQTDDLISLRLPTT